MTTIDWGRPGLEPRVEEIVHDPIVQLVMRRDRLTVAQVMATVARARGRVFAPLRPSRPAARIRPGRGNCKN